MPSCPLLSTCLSGLLAVTVLIPGPFNEVCHAERGCVGSMPPPIPVADPNYNRGILHDIEVPYFIDAGASDGEQAQIEAGFMAWQIALAPIGRRVTFARTFDETLAQSAGIDVVIGATRPGDPASFMALVRDTQTFELKAARITLDLRGGPSRGRLYFDPDLPGYEPDDGMPGAITKAMMHELGHALGLHHFAGRACTEQQSGASVMNGMCGINDHGAVVNGNERPPALAIRPSPCDVAAVWAVTVLSSRGR